MREEENDKKTLIFDRSLFAGPYVFAPCTVTSNQHRSLIKQTAKTMSELNPNLTKFDYIFYVSTPPEICMKRINERGRPEESNLTLEYLEQLDFYYTKWYHLGFNPLICDEVVTLDGTLPVDKLSHEVISYLLDKLCDEIASCRSDGMC